MACLSLGKVSVCRGKSKVGCRPAAFLYAPIWALREARASSPSGKVARNDARGTHALPAMLHARHSRANGASAKVNFLAFVWCNNTGPRMTSLTHLERLEAESIHIMREVAAEADKPVMLYSIGKDSAVMLHLAKKAFYPSPPPFPLLHVDTTWKFKAMYELRAKAAEEAGMELLVYHNPEAKERGINPFQHGPLHTDMWKTEGLKQALDKYGFDVAFGGARRDEEKSRAKERVMSFRTSTHGWDPKNQRPELWNLYNARKKKGEGIRCFPISNWTELDIWQYIMKEQIEIVPLYFAEERPTYEYEGGLFMADDLERLEQAMGTLPEITMKSIRFRTLGCFPLTGAVESTANTLADVVQETLLTTTSERQGRVIDKDGGDASMEKKKQEGYF
ncbi:sulfate adenylyltransferase subunit CysD [Aurantiacibacter sp. DGU5]|uniref:Sulfate adenylyltransferase subunit 2 n=1 Tax=Aurantiacibacter flavus TaxID=3145232 RepID=A0ABV0CYW5_9SPHN